MNTIKTYVLIISLLLLSNVTLLSQNAEKILDKYTENTGGQENWDAIHSLYVEGIAQLISQGGMELPFKRIMKKDGRQKTTLEVNGMQYVSIAFDGKIAWGSNQQMVAEEKSADITKNTKLSMHDFPYPGYHWKSNGYKVAYIGMATINDIQTYKIQLTKHPQWVDGKEVENSIFLYIDTQTYVPILSESKVVEKGPNYGKVLKSYLSDYKKIDGLSYPFTVTMAYDDDIFQVLKTHIVEWNPTIDETIFVLKKQK